MAWAQQPCTTDARRVVDEPYRHILGRQPDAAGLNGLTQRAMNEGLPSVVDAVRCGFRSSTPTATAWSLVPNGVAAAAER